MIFIVSSRLKIFIVSPDLYTQKTPTLKNFFSNYTNLGNDHKPFEILGTILYIEVGILEIIFKVGETEFIKPAMDEYEVKAMKILGNEFGFNTAIPTNAYVFKDELIRIVTELIHFNEFIVASDLLKLASMVASSNEWRVVK